MGTQCSTQYELVNNQTVQSTTRLLQLTNRVIDVINCCLNTNFDLMLLGLIRFCYYLSVMLPTRVVRCVHAVIDLGLSRYSWQILFYNSLVTLWYKVLQNLCNTA